MPRKLGFDRLVEQCVNDFEMNVGLMASCSQQQGWGLGDSPIEKLLFLALRLRVKFGSENIVGYKLEVCRDLGAVATEQPLGYPIIVVPQVNIDGIGRVDFLILAYATCERCLEPGMNPGWRKLIVECDGHEFHERTKEQAAKDRSRDRASSLTGHEVFRFTGAELWRDPWGCAGQIIAWVERGI